MELRDRRKTAVASGFGAATGKNFFSVVSKPYVALSIIDQR